MVKTIPTYSTDLDYAKDQYDKGKIHGNLYTHEILYTLWHDWISHPGL